MIILMLLYGYISGMMCMFSLILICTTIGINLWKELTCACSILCMLRVIAKKATGISCLRNHHNELHKRPLKLNIV